MADSATPELAPELQKARQDFEGSPDHAKFGPGIVLSGLLAEKGHYAEALAVLSRLQPLAEKDFEKAQILQKQGWIHLRQSQYDKAYYFLGEAMVKLGTHPDSLELFTVYHDLAWMSYRQGYLEKARNYSEGAPLVIRSMSQKSGPRVDEAKADLCHLMAMIEAASGEFDAALSHLENERQIRLGQDNPGKLAALYNKMSSVLQAKGDMKGALDFQFQTMDLAKLYDDLFHQAVSSKNLGEIYASLGNYDASLKYYQQSLELSQAVGNQLGAVFAKAGIGRILEARGNFPKAGEHLQEALNLARRIKSRERDYSLLVDLAELYVAWGKPPEAAKCLEAAQTLENELNEPISPRHVIVIAKHCWLSGQTAELARARRLLEELLSRPVVINDEEHASIPELEIEADALLARILFKQGDRDQAAAVLQRAVAVIDGFVRDLDERDRGRVLTRPAIREVFSLNARAG
ncbi:MAG: tetratricopeptide repeat protein [Candidatus Edwardsbacteria bacterium]|nr:tetratricopeptide repeat protein [Candidatus Edwardsbacteria bacterium]